MWSVIPLYLERMLIWEVWVAGAGGTVCVLPPCSPLPGARAGGEGHLHP